MLEKYIEQLKPIVLDYFKKDSKRGEFAHCKQRNQKSQRKR